MSRIGTRCTRTRSSISCGRPDSGTSGVAYSSPPPAASRLERVAVDRELAATPAGAALVELAEVFNRNVDRLNDLVFADQDYAAIATRGT